MTHPTSNQRLSPSQRANCDATDIQNAVTRITSAMYALEQENERLRAALQKLSEIRALGESTLGPMHGAGLEMAYGVVRDFAKKALSGDYSAPETSVATEAHAHYQPQIEAQITENNRLRKALDQLRAPEFDNQSARFNRITKILYLPNSPEETTSRSAICKTCGQEFLLLAGHWCPGITAKTNEQSAPGHWSDPWRQQHRSDCALGGADHPGPCPVNGGTDGV